MHYLLAENATIHEQHCSEEEMPVKPCFHLLVTHNIHIYVIINIATINI